MRKIFTATIIILLLFSFIIACDPQETTANNRVMQHKDKMNNKDFRNDKRDFPKMEWKIEDNSFTSNIDKNFETKMGNVNVKKNQTLTFFDATGKISLKEGDRPYGKDGVFKKAEKLIKTENSTQIVKNNDNKTIKNTENLEITYTLNKNSENNIDYTVDGYFDANVIFDCEYNRDGKPKNWFAGKILRHIFIERKSPQSGTIKINVNINNNGTLEQYIGSITFDGDDTALLIINGEEEEINLFKHHNKKPRWKNNQ